MAATRFIVFEVRLSDAGRQPFPEKMDQHNNVRLLDELGPLNALAVKQDIYWRGSRRETRKVDLLQAEIALELLEQASIFIKPSIEVAGNTQPLVQLLRTRGQADAKVRAIARASVLGGAWISRCRGL